MQNTPKKSQTVDSTTKPRPITIPTVILTLMIVAAIANSLGTMAMFKFGDSWGAPVLCFAIGALVAQPSLFAIWAAMATKGLFNRVGLSASLLFAITCTYIATFKACENYGSAPLEVYVFLFAIPVGVYSLIATTLGIYRWKTTKVISNRIPERSGAAGNQFSIMHMLAATTIVAILFTLGKLAFPNSSFQGYAPWFQIGTFICLYMLFTWAVSITAMHLVFNPRTYLMSVLALIAELLLLPILITVVLTVSFRSFQTASEDIPYSMCFGAGVACVMILTMSVFRLLGFRLYAKAA